MVKPHRRRPTKAEESWSRELQIFIFSVIIGLSIGAFTVFALATLPKTRELQRLRADLMASESALQECAARAVSQCPALPPPAPIPPAVVPAPVSGIAPPTQEAEEEIQQPTGQLPVPRRPPPRPKGEDAKVTVVGAAALTAPQSAALKVGEEKELAKGFRLRLSAISKRRTGNFCIVSGSGMPATGLRIAHNGSAKASWNNQRLTIGASLLDKQTCKVTVRPVS
jgi:type IV secretory pathway VirB10-like protein